MNRKGKKWMCSYSDCNCSSGEGFTRKGNFKLHLCLHCSESLHAEITQLQQKVKGINSRLNEMEMELKQLEQLTGKGTHFTLSPSVQLSSCVELEVGISGNWFHKTKLHMFKVIGWWLWFEICWWPVFTLLYLMQGSVWFSVVHVHAFICWWLI